MSLERKKLRKYATSPSVFGDQLCCQKIDSASCRTSRRLALTCLLLIFIIRDSEVCALQRAGDTNNVFFSGEPVGTEIKRDVASVIIKIAGIDGIEKAI